MLYSLDVEVAPITADDQRLEEGSRVELAGLVRDMGLNGQSGICMGRAPDGERWLIALLGGRRVNMKMSKITPAGDECGSTERVGRSTEQNHD